MKWVIFRTVSVKLPSAKCQGTCLIDGKLPKLPVAWCHQATNHCLSKCWPRATLPYGVISLQWVKARKKWWKLCRWHFSVHLLEWKLLYFIWTCYDQVLKCYKTSQWVNSSPPCATYMCQRIRSAQVQIMAPSHYINECWVIVNCTLRNEHQWNFY